MCCMLSVVPPLKSLQSLILCEQENLHTREDGGRESVYVLACMHVHVWMCKCVMEEMVCIYSTASFHIKMITYKLLLTCIACGPGLTPSKTADSSCLETSVLFRLSS